MNRCLRFALAWYLAAMTIGSSVAAHPLAPCLLELREAAPGNFDVLWKTPRYRPAGSLMEPGFPEFCRSELPTLEVEESAVRRRWRLDCGPRGMIGAELRVDGMALASDVVLARIELLDGRKFEALLSPGQPSLVIEPSPATADLLLQYIRLGMHHILVGVDHLLFVFGLLLLVFVAGPTGATRRLLATISAFTLGHCITLSLATFDVLRAPAPFTEMAIAVSVFALAVELARDENVESWMRRRPEVMSLLFGLLHGLGFAAALRDVGLPPHDVPLALLAFNVGIEIGQCLFVGGVLALRAAWIGMALPFKPWMKPIPVYGMGSFAAWWVLERSVAWLRG